MQQTHQFRIKINLSSSRLTENKQLKLKIVHRQGLEVTQVPDKRKAEKGLRKTVRPLPKTRKSLRTNQREKVDNRSSFLQFLDEITRCLHLQNQIQLQKSFLCDTRNFNDSPFANFANRKIEFLDQWKL